MIPLKEIQRVFENDQFATSNGMEIMEADINYSKCRMVIREEHKNARGAVMGGAIYTLADFAFAVAANPEHPETVTLDSSISFMNSTRGNVLYATARCEKDGRRTCCFNIEITDDTSTLVAAVRSTGMRVGTKPVEIDYNE
ncbi:PaaI family thioesterase [Hornefia butyriciproducens]|jgi:acyl-CoA thioesterase|nr:PaaI family thioesterase [Hornefia butyriciproducens]MCI7328092.1 PaaI family thioesterase [Clostridiales bacterium]MCI7412772.1 PaaI family thioesterase [Clostridiales bacterium]MCI7679264.1 PaaI family thioesterase [Clostridiales bacterium]MDD6298732.1 PaaI family thioesterase [Hornefia butyriciproducens]MDD7019571.1 PaaI family thioesterase [Hornefia butyriciproducens]